MSRRSPGNCFAASQFLFVSFFVLMAAGCGKSPNTTSEETTSSTSSSISSNPELAIPDGGPEQILEFIHKIRQMRPQFSSRQEMEQFRSEFEKTVVAACDKILAQDADDKLLGEATKLKLSFLIGKALDPGLPPAQTQASAKKALAAVNRYLEDKRKPVAEVADQLSTAARAVNLHSMSAKERKHLAEDTVSRVVNTKGSSQTLSDSNFLAEQSVKEGDLETMAIVCDGVAGYLEANPNERSNSFAQRFRAKTNRAKIIGSKLEISGKLLGGEDFDWESYRGKVVLVDFWATWCGPCVADLPGVKADYEKYHSKGFEVVGISLDHDRAKLESFLKTNPIPWAQLYEDVDPQIGTHPMAAKYDVSSIPTAFVVDRDGKVVSSEARGPELHGLLRRMFE